MYPCLRPRAVYFEVAVRRSSGFTPWRILLPPFSIGDAAKEQPPFAAGSSWRSRLCLICNVPGIDAFAEVVACFTKISDASSRLVLRQDHGAGTYLGTPCSLWPSDWEEAPAVMTEGIASEGL
mmetsp:Transcript_42086/g.105894  ORF Transcript_42086/g.105894 Transcript_42086/m.105894 type:complete len:123 (+) Transcript_42086:2818-3186(+)